MKVYIGSKNPGKIQACQEAFEKYFESVEVEGVSVSTDVPEQPFNEEVFQGAKNRVSNLKKYCEENSLEYDYIVSAESGITNQLGDWINLNIAFMENKDGLQSYGSSAGFPIPKKYIDKIKETNLTELYREVFSLEGEFQKGAGGIQTLTKGEFTRIDQTRFSFIMALTTYINDAWRD